jgi:hypothetical protein
MLASFAMLLDAPMDELIKEIGHDGSEVWWPNIDPPECHRGFHVQEFLDLCMKRGKILGWVEAIMTVGGRNRFPAKEINGDHEKRWNSYLRNFPGVILGVTSSGGRHAVAWNRDKIFDPKGFIVELEDTDLEPDTFHPLINL